jgi:hypothetical protein
MKASITGIRLSSIVPSLETTYLAGYFTFSVRSSYTTNYANTGNNVRTFSMSTYTVYANGPYVDIKEVTLLWRFACKSMILGPG